MKYLIMPSGYHRTGSPPAYGLVQVPLAIPGNKSKMPYSKKKPDQRKGHREDRMREFDEGEVVSYLLHVLIINGCVWFLVFGFLFLKIDKNYRT